MQPDTKSLGLTLALLLTAATHAESDQNLLVNPGFESISRELNDGEQTNGIGGADTLVGTRSPFPFGNETVDWSDPVFVTGWRTRTVPFGSADGVLAGALRPTNIDGMPFVTGIEGENALAIQASLVGQATDMILQPRTTYTLSFLGGISQFDSDYFFSVSIISIEDLSELPFEGQPGITRLELGRFFPPSNIPDGVMRRYEFAYTSPDVLPENLVGQHIGVSVFGSDGLPRVIYDDFVLNAQTVQSSCIADFTDDGVLDFFDVSAFLTLFGIQDAAGDLNNDHLFDFFDISEFLNQFIAGCP